MSLITRRKLIVSGLAATAGASGIALASRFSGTSSLIPPDCRTPYGAGETLTYAAQRLLTRHSLAREFPRGMVSKMPFANEIGPLTDAFKAHQANQFRDWKLSIDGLVARPTTLSVSDLRALATRSQITEVVCEEGWSYVAEWIGTPLIDALNVAGVLPQARYIVYFSFEKGWWDSIDMADVSHPQTVIAWGMNDGDLPVTFGGPLRLRVPRQLGYKSIKFLQSITVTDSLRNFGKGLGSASPEGGYSWYAGI